MTRITFDTATSINGWIADENNSLAWLFAVEGGETPAPDLAPPSSGVIVLGSTTYEWLLRESDLVANPYRWAEFFGDRPTFVFTSRRLPTPDGAVVSFVSGDVAQHLPMIKDAAGSDDVWIVGGGDLAAQFFDAGALTELAVSVAPVMLSGGAPLFPRNVGADRLRLVSARAVGQFARLVYEVTAP